MSDPEMLSVAPMFESDADYNDWLDMIHEEIQEEEPG